MEAQTKTIAPDITNAYQSGFLFWDVENTLNFTSPVMSHLENALHTLASAMIECLVAFFRFEHRIVLHPPYLFAYTGPFLPQRLEHTLRSYGFIVHSSAEYEYNAADRALLTDIYKLLASGKDCPAHIILVSGDADMQWGVQAAKLRGKNVHVVSWQPKVSRSLQQRASKFHSLETIFFRVATFTEAAS